MTFSASGSMRTAVRDAYRNQRCLPAPRRPTLILPKSLDAGPVHRSVGLFGRQTAVDPEDEWFAGVARSPAPRERGPDQLFRIVRADGPADETNTTAAVLRP